MSDADSLKLKTITLLKLTVMHLTFKLFGVEHWNLKGIPKPLDLSVAQSSWTGSKWSLHDFCHDHSLVWTPLKNLGFCSLENK